MTYWQRMKTWSLAALVSVGAYEGVTYVVTIKPTPREAYNQAWRTVLDYEGQLRADMDPNYIELFESRHNYHPIPVGHDWARFNLYMAIIDPNYFRISQKTFDYERYQRKGAP